MNINNFIPIIVTFIAGILALYQVKANIVSSARIKWSEELRKSISELYPEVLLSILQFKNREINLNKNLTSSEDYYSRYILHLTNYNILSSSIKMLLDLRNPKHKKIIEILEYIDINLNKENITLAHDENIEKELKKIVILANEIFYDEWSKSKSFFKKIKCK